MKDVEMGEKKEERGSDGQMGRQGGSFNNRAHKHPLIPNHVSLVFQRLAVTLRTLLLCPQYVSVSLSGFDNHSQSLCQLSFSLSLFTCLFFFVFLGGASWPGICDN